MGKRIWSPPRTSGMVQQRARELRKQMTEAETTLWAALRGRQFKEIKFRRQHPIGSYILDFFSYEHRLAIELDGDIHDSQVLQDQLRDETLRTSWDVRVLRFKNEEVMGDLGSVIKRISNAVAESPQPPTPSPSGRRGAKLKVIPSVEGISVRNEGFPETKTLKVLPSPGGRGAGG